MADTIEKIIKIESSGSEQTVKGLKKEIDSLRDALLNVEKGGDEYKKILEQLIGDQKRLADVMSAGKNEVSAATGSYNALKNEMSALKKVWGEVTDEASRSDIGKRIDAINTELKEMDASIGNFQRNVGNYVGGFKNARQELAALKTQMDNLEAGTAEYDAAFARAAEVTHTLQERQEMLRYSAADLGTQLSNVVSIGSSLAAGFNAVNAVMTLTGNESEDVQKAMLKLQAGIALVQGLQGLEGMTKRMKGLVDGLTGMIFKTQETTTALATNTVAVEANAAAQNANTVATAGATVATKAFQKALVATGIGAIVVLIGTLIAHWDDLKNIIGLSNEKLESFRGFIDQARVAIVGVANVIGNLLITPIKNAITYLSTLGAVMKDVFTLNFDKIGADIKEGFSKIVKDTKSGYDIMGNYQKGAEKQRERNEEKAIERAAKRRKEELEDIIKDSEAKYGSDWKYTNDAKKLYDEYYDKKLAGYKKDSKDYKAAQREKWSYDREYDEHRKQSSAAQSKQAKKETDERLKEADRIEKRAEDSQKTELQLLEEKYKEEKALLEQYGKDTTALTKEYEEKVTEIKKKEEDKRRQATEKIEKRAEDSQKTELQLAKEKYEEEKALLEQYGRDTTALTKEYEDKVTKIKKSEEEKRRQEEEKTARAAEAALREKTRDALKMSDRKLKTSDDTNEQVTTQIKLEYSLKEAKESGSLSFNDLIEQTNRIYEANKQHLLEQAAEYKALMENNEIDQEARENAERDYNNKMAELRNLDTQNLIDNTNLQREAIEKQIDMYSDLADSIADIFGSIADLMEEDIKNKVKNGKLTEEEGKKQFESVKTFQIAQATIQTISGAIAAFMGCQSLGQPWGAIIGAVQAAAVTAAGIAQIAKIRNTQFGANSSVSSSMSAGAVQAQPEEFQPQFTSNATGESEITKLADSIKSQRVYVLESDITEAQNKNKVRVKESTW